jgi:hypothetical protein
LTTPLGTFPIYDPAVSSSFFVPLGWDQTHISLMDLFFEPTSQIINPAYGLPAIGQAQVNFQGVQNGLETSVLPLNGGTATAFLFDDFSGQWLAVPEPSVLALGIFGLASSLFCRRGLRVICFCFLIAETPRRRGSETQSTEPPENHSDHPVKNDAFEKLLDAKFPPDTDVMAKAMTTTDSF